MRVPTLRWDFERKMPAEQKDVGRKESVGQISLGDFAKEDAWIETTEKQQYCGVYGHTERDVGRCILCEAVRR